MRSVFFILVIFLLFAGCARRQEEPEESAEAPAFELTLPQIPKLTAPERPEILDLEQMPRLTDSDKPTNRDIQLALQNAGFYYGKIDGIIGPLSTRAIREFQEKYNLPVDGQVGPKTWAVLENYLPDLPPGQER